MAIDRHKERLITLKHACQLFPWGPVHYQSVRNYYTEGRRINGRIVKLETLRFLRQRRTSVEAVERFIKLVERGDDDYGFPTAVTSKPKSPPSLSARRKVKE